MHVLDLKVGNFQLFIYLFFYVSGFVEMKEMLRSVGFERIKEKNVPCVREKTSHSNFRAYM